MSHCDCGTLDEIVNCGDDEQSEFVTPRHLRLVEEGPDARLYACPNCGTHWHVDHMQRGPQAIKVREPLRWQTFDDRPFRLKYMESFHGGESDTPCIWQGCERRALKNMMLCVQHTYPEFASTPR